MTTATDDLNSRLGGVEARLAAVEARLDGIDTQLVEMNANQRQMRAEHQADVRALINRIDQVDARLSAKIDQVDARLSAKIDRLLYAVIAFGALAIASLIGIIANLVITILGLT